MKSQEDFIKEIEELRAKIDIVKVIGSYISVIKKGTNYVAICPFHHDTNPSLSISVSKQIFRCFVCGTGGNAFTFIQKYENVPFKTAVKKACDICNVEAPSWASGSNLAPRRRENEEELEAVEKLAKYYQFMLRSVAGADAKKYLIERGLPEESIDTFKIGYAPLDQKLSVNYLRETEKIPVEVLDKAGICSLNSGELKDSYVDRIMFPLSDIYGNIVGFSGRKYANHGTENEPKYINSSESVIFKKSLLLYNFNNAQSFIKSSKCVYLLEGFMDVIALWRIGMKNAVGLMGTALTEDHIRLFQKLGCEVRLSLDGDEPGQMATERCLALLKDKGLKVMVVKPLKGGKDADEVLKNEGEEALRKAMSDLEFAPVHSMEFRLNHGQLTGYEEKENFLREMGSYYQAAPILAKSDIVNKLSAGLKVAPDGINSVFKGLKYQPASSFRNEDHLGSAYPNDDFASFVEDGDSGDDSQEDLSKTDVNTSLIYLFNREYKKKDLGRKVGLSSIISEECQLLVRMASSKKADGLVVSSMNSSALFYIEEINRLANYIDEIYGKKAGEEGLDEADFGLLQNKIEMDTDSLLSGLSGPGSKEEKDYLKEKNLLLNAVKRLMFCQYPSKEADLKELKKAIDKHKTNGTFFWAKNRGDDVSPEVFKTIMEKLSKKNN